MNYGNRNTSGYNRERINWDDSFKITASGHIAPALPLQPKILLQTSSCLIIIIILLHIFTVEQSLVYMMNIINIDIDIINNTGININIIQYYYYLFCAKVASSLHSLSSFYNGQLWHACGQKTVGNSQPLIKNFAD